jgi:hypothetical protein
MRFRPPLLASALASLSLVACGERLECGTGTHDVDGVCVADGPATVVDTNTITNTITNTNTNTNTITNTVTNTVVSTVTDGELDPGQFEETMVEIQDLVGRGGALGINGSGETHMHIAEMMYREGDGTTWPPALFYCSYTFGLLDATNLNSMSFLAQGWKLLPRTGTRDPGCMHMAFDESDLDYVYLTHHGNLDDGDPFVSGYNLNSTLTSLEGDPPKVSLAPIQLEMDITEGEVYEGLDVENGYIWVSAHATGLAVFQRDPLTDAINRISTHTGTLTDARDVAVVGNTAYVLDGPGGLRILDVTDPLAITELSSLPIPGVAVDIAIGDDNVIYIAGQAGGLSSVDVTDAFNPVILQTLVMSGSTLALDYDADKLYVAAWNDTRVYDVTDPANMVILGARRKTKNKNYSSDGGDEGERPDITNRVLGVAGSGDYVFGGTWWTPTNFLLHPENVAPYMVLPETVNYLAFPGDLAVGKSSSVDLVIQNEGNAPLTVFDLWTTDPAFTVTPDQLYIEPGMTGTVTVTFTATIGAGTQQTVTTYGTQTTQTGQEEGFLEIWSDDPSQPVREAYLVGNPAGIAIGDPYTNDATLLDGTPWSFTTDALGSVTLVSYFATF